MEKDLSLEYDMMCRRCCPSHWPGYFLLPLLSRSSRFLCHCCFLHQRHRFLMNCLTLKGQVSDLGLHSLARGFQLRPGRREVIHRQSRLHIDQ